MLRIYFREDNEIENPELIVRDVEKMFEMVHMKGEEKQKKMIQLIEHGSYNDENSFIDRFGYKLYYSELSTGCKAALVVLAFPDKIIDLRECGLNARDIIVSICDEGNILISDSGITFCDYADSIKVRVDDYLFNNIERLNIYVNEERPFAPVMDGGIVHV